MRDSRFYFEVQSTDGGYDYYWADSLFRQATPGLTSLLTHMSGRIWRENAQGVTYAKHRDCEDVENEPVDLKEFVMVKLRAQPGD
jgi:hypothetical protein